MTHKLLSRGQTLVLFALTLLLLTLLVTLTLSFGSKVKEKMEVQAAADAAAYSQAATTARVFNEMALMSRAQIGHLVSKAAVNSLIDWSSYYRAQIGATRNAYTIAMLPYIALLPCCIPYSGCSSFCRCAIQGVRDITRSQNALSRYDRTEIAPQWDQLERPAAQRALRLSQAAQQMFVVGQVVQYGRMMLDLNNQSAANDIIDSAGAGSRWAGSSEWMGSPPRAARWRPTWGPWRGPTSSTGITSTRPWAAGGTASSPTVASSPPMTGSSRRVSSGG